MRRFFIIIGVCCVLGSMASLSLASRDKEAITEITLEMTQGLANGRAFKIVLRKDGTALYHGMSNVPLEGKFNGIISREDFDKLVEFLTVRNFNKIKSSTGFTSSPTIGVSAPVVVTSVVEGGERRTVVRAYRVKMNSPDPPAKELLEIENAITTLATQIKWDKTKK